VLTIQSKYRVLTFYLSLLYSKCCAGFRWRGIGLSGGGEGGEGAQHAPDILQRAPGLQYQGNERI
jgi:hypothetical protein